MLPDRTARLRFREMTEADDASVGEILEVDSASSAYAGRDPTDWIAWNRRGYIEHGFGLWLLQADDAAVVGDCGLTMQQVEGEWLVEVGWHTHPDHRGRAYAPEAASAVLAAARSSGLTHVVAIIDPANLSSQRVAEKIGLALEREALFHGAPALVFGIDLGS